MKKAIFTSAATLVLAASLAACGSATGGSSTESVAPVEPATKSTQAATPAPPAEAKSERGNTIKKVGEPSFWRVGDVPEGAEVGRFTIKKIAPVTCTEQFASKPTNGHLVGLTVDVVTKKELANETIPTVNLSGYSFEYIAPNGTTFNGNLASAATYGCLDQSLALKSEFGPAEKGTGIIVLDLPSKGGVLKTGKVEWNLP